MVLKKTQFKPYDWLNFEPLIESKSYRFEIYFDERTELEDIEGICHSLFKELASNFYVGQFGANNQWGDFCLDTWDIDSDQYDYSLEGKSKATAAYLTLLKENDIEPEYSGFCELLDWNKFLPIILDCIMSHVAPYSTMIYAPEKEFVFYLHHSRSIGLYYKDLSDEIRQILQKARRKGLTIDNTNDERIAVRKE